MVIGCPLGSGGGLILGSRSQDAPSSNHISVFVADKHGLYRDVDIHVKVPYAQFGNRLVRNHTFLQYPYYFKPLVPAFDHFPNGIFLARSEERRVGREW